MVNTLLYYIGQSIKNSIQFIDRVDSPTKKLEKDSRIYKGIGEEKEDVSISDIHGNACYIRQTQSEQGKEIKRKTSCDKRFMYAAKSRLIYYSFNDESKEFPTDKRKQALTNVLNNIKFGGIRGMATQINIVINAVSDNFEKIFKEETNTDYEGGNWPIIIAIDFTLNYNTSTNSECQELCDDKNFEVIEGGFIPEGKTFCERVYDCEKIDQALKDIEALKEVPPGMTCKEIENCDFVNVIKEDIIDLQEQIDNIPKITGTIVMIENINAFEVVNADGTKADSTIVNKRDKAIGITLQAINNGFSGDYQSSGAITNPLWNFVKGDILFLNGNSISNISVLTGFSQIIGKAISSDTINININQAIRL